MSETPRKSETPLYNQIILAHSNQHTRLFRMQCGKFRGLHSDHVIAVGVPGFSDLFGLRSRIITSDLVGTRIAQFVAIECKAEGRRTDKDRKVRQDAFITLIGNLGGIAGYARSVEDASLILRV